MMHWGGFGWGMGFGWLAMVLFWTLVIYGLSWIGRTASAHRGPTDAPLDILRRRYAHGEITREEYERRKNDLTR